MAAANRYTTTEFLASVKLKGHIPTNQSPFTDANILSLGDDEISTKILSQIKVARENYYLTYKDTSANATGIYTIPPRAVGGAISLVQLVNGSTLFPVSRCELSEQFSTESSPAGFYQFQLSGQSLKILPVPSDGTVRQHFMQMPNKMVATTAAAQITVIAGTTLTFASIPSTITTSTACDFIQDQPGFDWLAIDQTPATVTSTQLTFASVPPTLAVGDWVALAGQTPVPQIPVEFRPLLVQRVVARYYEIQGYLDKKEAAEKTLREMEKAVFELINPRVSESPKRIVADGSLIGGYTRWRKWRAT